MSTSRFDVVVAQSMHDIEDHLPAWRELHDARLEDNIFMSPAYLAEIYRRDIAPINVLFAYRLSSSGRTLVAVAPFGSPRRQDGVSTLPFCESNFVYSSTPLLHVDFANEASTAICDWLDVSGYSIARWENLELDSRAWLLMKQQLDERGRRWWVRHEFQRPTMDCAAGTGDWLTRLSPKARRTYRSSRRKLEASGALEVRLHRNLEGVDLLPTFLEIESRSWKGLAGTALTSKTRHVEFVSAVASRLGAQSRLFFVEVSVDDEPVSVSLNLVDGTTVYGFKVAHAPAFASASPGIFNTLEVARLVHEDTVLTAANSCSDADSCLLRYWADWRPVGTVLTATRNVAGSAVLSMLTATRWTRQQTGRLLGQGSMADAASNRGPDRAASAARGRACTP